MDSELKQWRVKTTPGMNTKYEDLDLQDKWVELAQNCRFEDEPGSVAKRDPVTYFNTSSVGTGAVTGLYRFYKSDGTIKFVMTHGTTAYVGDDGAGTWTAIRTNLTDGKRMAFETYQDRLICSNGFDNPFVYDGASDNVSWELGACKALLGTGAGNLDASADYYYSVTFDNDAMVSGAVSNTVTTDGSNQQIELSNIPLGPLGTVNRKIYRTEGDGSALKLLATIGDNTTTTYTDNVADGSLGVPLPSVTDSMPLGSILKIHRERLFISGDPSNPNKIYFSNVYRPHYIQQTTNLDYMEISPEDGDEIMGIPIQLGVMMCIKKNTIRRVNITSPTSGADPNTWTAEDPQAFVGSPAQWSIVQTMYGILFLGWDGWYRFDGSRAERIIDEFDVNDILPSSYSDVVAFYHKGVLLAAYSDNGIAAQYHNRIMRYNFQRTALSLDIWTSTTVSGANCFAAKAGDDEKGELYYGDSVNGYVLKAKTTEDIYRLSNKTDVNNGTKTTVFVGGTESAPYIEPGSSASASAIPDDICILWDDEVTSPGTGWVEITGQTGRYIKINATTGTQGGGSGHTHSMTGNIDPWVGPGINSGDGNPNATVFQHSHSVSATSGSNSDGPRYTSYRIFRSSSNTATQFPVGAIVMWDQPTAPTGWQVLNHDGYYGRIDSSSLDTSTATSHSHSYSGTTGQDNSSTIGNSDSGTNCPRWKHTHTFSGTTNSTSLDSWELDYVSFTLIKKIGEEDTWDGLDKYVYALYYSAGTPTGWTDETATYSDRYLKFTTGTPATGAAANASHTHTASSITSSGVSATWGNDGYLAQCMPLHTHPISWTSISSTSMTEPTYLTFRLFKRVLGTMQDYNNASLVHQGTGTWTSPAQEINAEALNLMSWNETLVAGDTILLHTRSGATQVACEAAAWSVGLTDPNGSQITSNANVWFQYKIEFTAVDTTANIPRVYFSDGYVVKYTYQKSTSDAETSVAFKYQIGFRNFDLPMVDKIFKKVQSVHEGEVGSFDVTWETENATDMFTVSLASNPKRWDSYFQSTAMGTEIDFDIYKNDLHDFKISELKGLFTVEPTLL